MVLFSRAHRFFSPLYTIHGMIRDKMVPLVYCLLPKKDIRTYRRMIRSIQDVAADRHPELRFIPTQFQMDYEMAIISTLRQLFPEVSRAPEFVIHGCHFHFCEYILRQMNERGIMMFYSLSSEKFNQDFSVMIRRIMALALMPLDKLDVAYEIIMIDAVN